MVHKRVQTKQRVLLRQKKGILENVEGICYNMPRQNEVIVQSDKAKAPELQPLGLSLG